MALLAGVGMTAMMGMAAFAIDLGAAYNQRAVLQGVADSAAMAGAISWVKTGSSTAVAATVKDIVIANGWPASIVQATAAPTASKPTITVSLAAPSSLTLGRVLGAGNTVTTTGYAVATVKSGSTTACLVALSTLMVNGSVSASGCAVVADATWSSAITVNSGGSLSAAAIETPGGIVKNGSVSGTVTTGSPAAQDPYTADQTPANNGFVSCQNYNNQSSLTPGCYSNVNVNSVLTLSAGTYFFTNINVNSGGSITGTGGVTLVLQQNFSPSGNITITAPTTGSWAGMAIYAMGGMNVNSNVTYTVNGAIYSPSGSINLNSGTWNQSACTFIVAQQLTLNSGASLTVPQTNCGAYASTAPKIAGAGSGAIALVQ